MDSLHWMLVAFGLSVSDSRFLSCGWVLSIATPTSIMDLLDAAGDCLLVPSIL